jgi:lipoyl(octanoyl) transferase
MSVALGFAPVEESSAAATRTCDVYRVPSVPYGKAWGMQRDLVRKRKACEVGDTLLLVEHPHVITLGRNGKREHLLSSPERLADAGIEFLESDRGGDITYHGPGQLVGYPIIDLSQIRKDVVWYVRTLEEALIRTLDDLEIEAGRVQGCTGVWVNGAKVAAIGVHISRWVTSHGFALNINTDLNNFRHIIPCGIAARPVTSLRELMGAPVSRAAVEERLVAHLGELLGMRMRYADLNA